MPLYKYHLIDKEGKVRIGYMEGASASNVEELLKRSGIMKLTGMKEVHLEDSFVQGRRLFHFIAKQDATTSNGTIEQVNATEAFKELERDYKVVVEYILDKPIENTDEALVFTKKIRDELASYAKTHQDETSAAKSVVDSMFNEILTLVEGKTEELSKDKEFAEDVKDLHETITIIRRKEITTTDDKFQTLRFMLRSLSFIEDSLDPSPLKSEIRGIIDKVVELLKKLENYHSNSAFGMSKEVEHTDFDNPLLSKEENEAAKKYLAKKKVVKEFQEELASLHTKEEEGSFDLPPQDISLRTVLLKEIPALLDWLILFFMFLVLFSQILALTTNNIVIGSLQVSAMLQTFAGSTLYIKTVLFLIMFYTFVQTARTFAGKSLVVLGSLFSFFILTYVLIYLI